MMRAALPMMQCCSALVGAALPVGTKHKIHVVKGTVVINVCIYSIRRHLIRHSRPVPTANEDGFPACSP